MQESYQTDPELSALFKSVETNPAANPTFKIVQRVLLCQGKIYINSTSTLKNLLLEEFHSSPLAGHTGIQKTLARLSANFLWSGMRADVTKYVNSCLTCQTIKSPNHKPYGLLQPIPIPTGVWEDISMDFVVSLPPYHGHTTILVVVDRFSKASHFATLPTSYTASQVADVFAKTVCKLHGMPRSIISDRDPVFVSRFWQTLFRLSGTKLRMSTAYHPQSDRQTEAVNRMLQQYLRAYAHDRPHTWGKYLHWAEFVYNTSVHSSTGLTPFTVVYGKPLPSLPNFVIGSSPIEAIDEELSNREQIVSKLTNNLQKAQENMKHYADNLRTPHPFKQGDMVWVKLQPHRQSSVAGRRIQKLAPRYYGPYMINRCIGEVALEVELPPGSKIHLVFHASKLKPFKGEQEPPKLGLPPHGIANEPLIEPLAFLGVRNQEDPT